jgi:D-glycero-D-manno-heptose 1,7-bisphosphate phosphatase
MHRRLRDELPLDDIVVCPHDGKEGCWCRKPRPGMILDAARRLGLDLDHSVAVGDRWRDIDAAHRAGVASVWIDWGLGEALRDAPDARFGSLAEARDHVLMVCGAERAD